MLFTPVRIFSALVVGFATVGWQQWSFPAIISAQLGQSGQRELASAARIRLTEDDTFSAHLIEAALNRAGKVVRYDASYKKITFPQGDVPAGTGCASDEIIRSYRQAGIDLQELVYLDMVNTFGAYPRAAGKSKPDSSMDHRLVPNLQVFFQRCGVTLPLTRRAQDYQPGDIVTCRLPNGKPHVAIVVPAPGSGRPWIMHNMGYGPRLEDRLFEFTLTGHYRYCPRA